MNQKILAQKYLEKESSQLGQGSDFNLPEDFIDLSIGDPDIDTFQVVIDETFKDVSNGATHYSNPRGEKDLLEALAKSYQEDFQVDSRMENLMITTSACHGMWLVLSAVLNPDEEVLTPGPYFSVYRNQVSVVGGKLVEVLTTEERGFIPTIADFEKCLTKKTKAIILNSPNNPTGICYSMDFMLEVLDFAKKHDLLLIMDDIYGALSFADTHVPLAQKVGVDTENMIIVGSFSKDYAMTGWRVGYLIGPEYLIDTCLYINTGVVYAAPTPSQRAALHALENREEIKAELKNIYQKRVHGTYDMIQAIPKISVQKPKGSIYLFMNIKETGYTSVEFTNILKEQFHVQVVPGSDFGKSGEGFVRIAVTVPILVLKEAFARIQRLLS